MKPGIKAASTVPPVVTAESRAVPTEDFSAVDVTPDDIGGELLPILSKGLYTDPLHAVREYVQNAVDAEAHNVSIQFTGQSIIITDDGKGMTWDQLLQARQFGVSTKNAQEHVGFRGIGVYSGFDLCNRLLVTTSVEGEPYENVLVFDFGGMKNLLKQARAQGAQKPPLHTLLQDFSQFKRVPAAEASHYTVVQLEEVDAFHLGRLKDEEALRKYILKTLPIGFDEHFAHRETIQKTLTRDVPGFKAVRVVLEITPGKRVIVAKPAIPNLFEPSFHELQGPTGKRIAVIWSCLTGADGTRQKIADGIEAKKNDKSFIPFRGFVYKVKGFTIGDNTSLQNVFARSTLYSWYTGEVYVVDEDVRPNTERDDFESSAAYEYLKTKVEETLSQLEGRAGTFQAQGRAAELFARHADRLATLERDIANGVGRNYEHWSELKAIVEELTKQKAKLAEDNKQVGRDVLKKATALRDAVEKSITKSSESRRRAKPSARDGTEDTTTDADAEEDDDSPRHDATLGTLVEDAGIDLPEQARAVLGVLDEAIASVLFRGSSTHTAVLAEADRQLRLTFGEPD